MRRTLPLGTGKILQLEYFVAGASGGRRKRQQLGIIRILRILLYSTALNRCQRCIYIFRIGVDASAHHTCSFFHDFLRSHSVVPETIITSTNEMTNKIVIHFVINRSTLKQQDLLTCAVPTRT